MLKMFGYDKFFVENGVVEIHEETIKVNNIICDNDYLKTFNARGCRFSLHNSKVENDSYSILMNYPEPLLREPSIDWKIGRATYRYAQITKNKITILDQD